MSGVRIFFVGGLTSYRALFSWLSPWILIPTFCIGPLFQILLFAYIGRSAGLASDKFYVTGNALQYAAIPCLFAMSQPRHPKNGLMNSCRSCASLYSGER